MKKLILLAFALVSCGSVGLDNTPAWDTAGRLGLEMKNDCNTTTHSVGISGCSFRADQLGGNLTLPSLWTGTIGLTSYYCKSLTAAANSTTDNIFAIRDLYTTPNKRSCSFELTRTIREGDLISDNTLKGRFFIKILPEKGFVNLRFAVGNDNFNGVGWYQRKYQTDDAVLVVKPRTNSGMFTITCAKDDEPAKIVYRAQYNTSPFEVKLNSNDKCDYEMVAVNFDPIGEDNEVETATYIHHIVPNYTRDISVPAVTKSSRKVTFTFNDRDGSGRKPVVAAVQVGNTKFLKTNKGTGNAGQSVYIVKGLTPSIRFFYGEYDITNNKWIAVK